MSNNTWIFWGRYGDDETTVLIDKLPEELSKTDQKTLLSFYNSDKNELSGDFAYKMQNQELLREVGNEWNHNLAWAPQVHEWATKINKLTAK